MLPSRSLPRPHVAPCAIPRELVPCSSSPVTCLCGKPAALNIGQLGGLFESPRQHNSVLYLYLRISPVDAVAHSSFHEHGCMSQAHRRPSNHVLSMTGQAAMYLLRQRRVTLTALRTVLASFYGSMQLQRMLGCNWMVTATVIDDF